MPRYKKTLPHGPISTPLVAAGRVYGLGPRGQLFALDPESGEPLWSTLLIEEHSIAKPMYGFGTSPILEDGVLVVSLGGEGTAVGGFDPATGELRWTAGSDAVGYQSAIPFDFDGRRQIVATGLQQLFGLDPANGEILWQWPHSGGGARGALSLVPVAVPDGRLFLTHQNDGSVMVAPRRENGSITVEEVWNGRAIRNTFDVAVHSDGHLYSYSSRFLTCVDAATGEARWRSRQPGDGFLILVDGHLVIVTKAGGVHVVEATPEAFRARAGLDVFDDVSWTLPSFAGGSIYARSLGEIARIDVTAETEDESPETPATSVGKSAFQRFLATVRQSADDKTALIDRFLKDQKGFPIIEGSRTVHFVYRGPADDMALAGDMLGMRSERRMKRLEGTDFFYYSLELEDDERLNYVFLRDFETILDPLNPRSEPTSSYSPDLELLVDGTAGIPMSWFAMPAWQRPEHLDPAPEPRGRIEEHIVESTHLGQEIPLRVYLPPGYGEEKQRYPVAYVHLGGGAVGPGRVPNSLDHLIGRSVEPLIVVFMKAKPDHLLALIPWLDPLERALVEEIVPFVDGHYPTIAAREARANVGSGGIPSFAALVMTLRHPELFGKLGLQTLLVTEVLEPSYMPLLDRFRDHPPRIYLEWGKYDFRSHHEPIDLTTRIKKVTGRLEELGVTFEGGVTNDGFGWSSWRNRTDRLYGTLFPLTSP